MVGGGESVEAPGLFEIEEGPIPEAPPGALSTRNERCCGVDPQRVKGDRYPGAEVLTEGRVAIRFGAADTVMDVCGLEAQPEFRFPEEVEKGDRIGATRKRNQDPTADQVREAGLEVLGEFGRKHGSS